MSAVVTSWEAFLVWPSSRELWGGFLSQSMSLRRLVCVCNGRVFLCLLCKCDFKMTPLCHSYVGPYLESQEGEVLPGDWQHSVAAFFLLGILYDLSQMRLCDGFWDRKFYILQLLIGCSNEAGYLALLIILSCWKEEKMVTRKQFESFIPLIMFLNRAFRSTLVAKENICINSLISMYFQCIPTYTNSSIFYCLVS